MAAKKQKEHKSPKPVDIHVGARIRLQRNLNKISQTELGNALGITFQQIQKYEKGTNRVGASRLQDIARVLGVPVAYFFDGAPHDNNNEPKVGTSETGESDNMMEFLTTRQGINLVRAFVKIKDDKVRQQVVQLVKAMADD